MGVVGSAAPPPKEGGPDAYDRMLGGCKSVCTVRCVGASFDGMEDFLCPSPFPLATTPAEFGNGGGDDRPLLLLRDGLRPGCEEERERPVGRAAIELAECVESAGEEERGVGGAEVLVRRCIIVP